MAIPSNVACVTDLKSTTGRAAQLFEAGLWEEELIVDDEAVDLYWPSGVRDSLADVVRRVRATDGTVAR